MYNDIRGGFAGTGNINCEPSWMPDCYHPDSMNKCIGRGTDAVKIDMYTYKAPSTDYYGNPRPNPVDEYIDMGAIESSFVVGGIRPSTYNSLSLYPNPAKDHVVLLADHYDHYTLELYTSGGQLLRQQAFLGTSCTVDLSAFEKGMYLLLIRSEGKVWTNKLVKQ